MTAGRSSVAVKRDRSAVSVTGGSVSGMPSSVTEAVHYRNLLVACASMDWAIRSGDT